MRLFCADYLLEKGLENVESIAKQTKAPTAKDRIGWAEAKPKTNRRRINKKRSDPKRQEKLAEAGNRASAARPATPAGRRPKNTRSKNTGKK